MTVSYNGNFWSLTFRDGNESGALRLPMPAKMLSYAVDTHDGQKSAGGGSMLYKEWRFEGQVSGTGIFKQGIIAPTKYFLVFQGRGNRCEDAGSFTHWRLEITGRKARYAFYGELAEASNSALNSSETNATPVTVTKRDSLLRFLMTARMDADQHAPWKGKIVS